MRKLIKLLTGEEIIIIFLTLILLGCSYLPLVRQYLNPSLGKVFLGSSGYPVDFFGYILALKEGELGYWQYIPKLTSTLSGNPTFIKIDYLFLGHLSRILSLNPIPFFHLLRFFLSIIFIFIGYYLISQIFSSKSLRLTAFLLAFFSTTLDLNAGSLIDLWTPLAVFQRSAYYPHYLFSFIFTLLVIILLHQALTQKKLSSLLGATFLGFLAAQIHPPAIISLYLTFPFYLILTKKNRGQKFTYLALFSLVSSLPLFYLRQVSSLYPWNLVAKIDVLYSLHQFISPGEFFLGIGPTAILALFGAWLAIKKGKEWHFLLAPWAIVYIIGFFFIHQIISANSVRFLQTPFFLILGILSTFTIKALADFISKKGWFWSKKSLPYLLVFLVLILNLPAYNQSLRMSQLNFSHLHPYINTSPQMISAFNWLTQNSEENEVVLASQTNGMLIAALSGNLPYLTPFAQILENYTQLGNNIEAFFSQSWTERQARALVEKENIKLVFFGPEEKNFGQKTSLDWPFLTKVFENSKVVIYRTEF